MKILCLHAMGTSGDVLRKQLAALQHADFLTESYPGIEGASLATSFLLQHRIDHPHEPMPFSFAILFNANLVVSPDEHFCEEEILNQAAKSQNSNRFGFKSSQKSLSNTLNGKRPRLQSISKHKLPGKKSEIAEEVIGLLGLSLDAAESEGWVDRQVAFEGKTVEDFPRIVHPLMLDARIDIPTSIIVGKQDALFLCGLVQKRLCKKGLRNFVVHAEGHDIPRAGPALEMAASGCKWAINQAQIATMGGGAR
nr:hypothetical protein CFP56_76227 [Quercus suber]